MTYVGDGKAPSLAVHRASKVRAACAALAVGLLAGSLSSCSTSGRAPGGHAGTPSESTASASDPATDPAFAAFYGQNVTWRGCDGHFECTTVKVPLDWAKPAGDTIALAVVRMRASRKRLGSLFHNPGGPGVPGVEFLKGSATSFGDPVRRSYDLVSWDTRGIGQSKPSLACLPDSQLDAWYAQDPKPNSPQEVPALTAAAKKYVAACEKNSGALLAHVDTISTVKDLDVLRAVVKDDKVNFMGASYGTFLGAWYAQLFPWRVGRMVLDGATDPNLTSAEFYRRQAAGFSRSLDAFIDHCLRNRYCPFKDSRAHAHNQIGKLYAAVAKHPLPADRGRPLTQGLLSTGMLSALYSSSDWDTLMQAFIEAFQGRGSTMLFLADRYVGRGIRDDGRYDQTMQVIMAIHCLDHQETRSVDQIASDVAALDKTYPPLGGSIDWVSVDCALWPYKAVVPKQATTAHGARPILVVGATNDSATPYEGAQALAAQLESGRLLTRKGDGHTSYLQGSRCTDTAIETYLVSGTLPAEGTICS